MQNYWTRVQISRSYDINFLAKHVRAVYDGASANRRYARASVAKILRNGGFQRLEQLIEEARETAEAAALRARLYAEFRDLSERQKTKRGGFSGFVRKSLGENGWATAHPLVKQDLGREVTSWEARVNYRAVADSCRRRLELALRAQEELTNLLGLLFVRV